MSNKNMIILFLTQAIGASASAMIFMLGALVSESMHASKWVVTLPVCAMILGTLFFSLPSAWLMKKCGRKVAFIIGSIIATLGAFFAIIAIYYQLLWLFITAAFLLGINNIFVQQYRYAVTDHVSSHIAAKLVSIILFANIFSAFIGTMLSVSVRNLLPYGLYSASFCILFILFLLNILLLSFLKMKPVEIRLVSHQSYFAILKEPQFIFFVLLGACATMVMVALMTALPIHMKQSYPVSQIALVLQAHYLAMYLPSLFTGFLLHRFDKKTILFIGLGLFMLCHTLGIFSHQFFGLLCCLILLGVGWNIFYLVATVSITSLTHLERYKAQSLNELIVFSANVLMTFISGYIVQLYGWSVLNISAMVMLLLLMILYYASMRATGYVVANEAD